MEQVLQLAEVIKDSQQRRKKLAIHCLAGIGRTSTMLISAHLTMGDKLDRLKALIAKQNPSFVLTGSQAEFIYKVSEGRPGYWS